MEQRWVAFEYRDFYDLPRMLVVQYAEIWYLFDSKFDEANDDYDDGYEVYEIPALTEDQLRGDWRGFVELARKYLGRVRVADVRFDPSRRKEMDLGILAQLVG